MGRNDHYHSYYPPAIDISPTDALEIKNSKSKVDADDDGRHNHHRHRRHRRKRNHHQRYRSKSRSRSSRQRQHYDDDSRVETSSSSSNNRHKKKPRKHSQSHSSENVQIENIKSSRRRRRHRSKRRRRESIDEELFRECCEIVFNHHHNKNRTMKYNNDADDALNSYKCSLSSIEHGQKQMYDDDMNERLRQHSETVQFPISNALQCNKIMNYTIPFSWYHEFQRLNELDQSRRLLSQNHNENGKIIKPAQYIEITRNIGQNKCLKLEKAQPCECTELCGAECINSLCKVECVNCHSNMCYNQRFQRKQWKKVKVVQMGSKGFGLIALESIHEGEFIIEYCGEIICTDEMHNRLSGAYRNDTHFYMLSLSPLQCIDSTRRGNLARFTNHSCNASCEVQKWNVNQSIRVGIFACRHLKKGDEITIDYKFVRSVGSKKQQCMCGEANCRGYIGAKPQQSILKKDKRPQSPKVWLAPAGYELYNEFIQQFMFKGDREIDEILFPYSIIRNPVFLMRNVKKGHANLITRLEKLIGSDTIEKLRNSVTIKKS